MPDKMMRIAGRSKDGKAKAISVDGFGNLGMNLKGYLETEILHDGTNGNSDGIILDVREYGMVSVQINGLTGANIRVSGSVTGGSYQQLLFRKVNEGEFKTNTDESGIYIIDCQGISFIKATVYNYVSGTINVTAKGEPHGAVPVIHDYINALSGKTGGIVTESRFGNMAAKATEVLFDYDTPFVLEELELSTNNHNTLFMLNSGLARLSNFTSSNGMYLHDLTIKGVHDNRPNNWIVNYYDEVSKEFKVSLKSPLKLPEGAKLEIRNREETTVLVGVRAIIREI